MRPVLAAAAALAALAASPAAAVVIATGSVTPDQGFGYQPHGGVAFTPGDYRLTVTLDRAVDRLYLTETLLEVYNQYCDPDGSGTIVYCGGDDVPTLPDVEGFGVKSVSLLFTLNAGYVTPRSDGGYETTDFFDQGGHFEFETGEVAPFAYTLSLDAVPEPRAWALLILGFGATGVSLRRARGRGARPHPA
ncbi:MAG TPA: PEPxxWA-CTERM sorting domain-containing protein [Sphingomonas sp.]|jgi:hypothetical protein|nr:PEPxxWA-CTERM sorting domain-containing protein [Sphingomonas sp.]